MLLAQCANKNPDSFLFLSFFLFVLHQLLPCLSTGWCGSRAAYQVNTVWNSEGVDSEEEEEGADLANCAKWKGSTVTFDSSLCQAGPFKIRALIIFSTLKKKIDCCVPNSWSVLKIISNWRSKDKLTLLLVFPVFQTNLSSSSSSSILTLFCHK